MAEPDGAVTPTGHWTEWFCPRSVRIQVIPCASSDFQPEPLTARRVIARLDQLCLMLCALREKAVAPLDRAGQLLQLFGTLSCNKGLVCLCVCVAESSDRH